MRTEHDMLRHSLATLAYRTAKAVRGAPPGFEHHAAGTGARTSVQILAHMGDLMDWGLSMTKGKGEWIESPPKPWDAEVERFFASVTAWDEHLATGGPPATPSERLFQGAIADALTHTGQLTMLRRLAGSPIRGESYNQSPIAIGRTGRDQPPATPGSEFD